VILLQDVITSGSSVLETASLLRSQGLVVDSALVFLDRQQGGQQILAENGIQAFCVTDIALLVGIPNIH
jgi:orotate phosphoribosyltransferase